MIFLNAYIHWIQYLARIKLLHQHERQKSVHAGARFDLLFLIQKLQDLTIFCSKLFKRFLCLKCSTALSVSTSQYWKHLARSKIFHPYPRQNLVHAGAPLFLLFLIGKLQDLTSSSREIIWKVPFLKKSLWITCSKNKNFGNIWRKVSSFIRMKDRNYFMHSSIGPFFC